jgi:hypothetical protein
LVGIGEGIGTRFLPGATWVVCRAGFVARARLTVRGLLAAGLRAFGREVDRRRDEAFVFADRCVTLLLSRFKPASLSGTGAPAKRMAWSVRMTMGF